MPRDDDGRAMYRRCALHSGLLRRHRNSPSWIFLAETGGQQAEARHPFNKRVASYGDHLLGTDRRRQQLIRQAFRLKWRAVPPGRRWPRERLQREARYVPDEEQRKNSERTARIFAVFSRATAFGPGFPPKTRARWLIIPGGTAKTTRGTSEDLSRVIFRWRG